MQAVDRDVYM